MREIDVKELTSCIKQLCIQANKELPCSVKKAISKAREQECSEICKSVLGDLEENIQAAKELDVPVCQDTGMAVVFLEIGQDVHFIGGDFNEAVNEGVRQGYLEGLLRLSVVADPIRRGNTNDNTPAILHTSIIPGDKVKIMVAPKGFGSENMSAIRMFTPSATRQEIIGFVVDTVRKAGSNPCPPVIVGVGIGGDFEQCALLAKQALCRDLDQPNPDPFYAELEQEMLQQVNQLGIGSQGFGGDVTALGLNIETYATHIAGLPVAVNMGCHVTRHMCAEL
ncbi:fumarate hydratase [Massilioclostridium coli]|uniref:fumarate hydratase n=1 Tax=Massilioclostridium coli TaxID=1870991 RepID=UPI000D798417|nr:fumarate hydratase [Massilioclostridium coli]PWM98097.1 MAG: fumarate hydratase [Massilioclostridium sp.]PWM99601.1 MAG: fumarate hydratase [Massilioclostridium sp.]